MLRSTYCGTLNDSHIGDSVELAGWVHRRRDHGGVIFIDLRDREGLVQVVCNPEQADLFKVAETIRNEFVCHIKGDVRARPEGTVNKNLPTGAVEVVANELEILNSSDPLPFRVDEYTPVGEETCLRYRYVDLRRPELNQTLRFRAKVTHAIRDYMEDKGFIDIETPILTKATPEGARDYLVPSRTHDGKFFALPQSPQVFKQLLMMSGFDRYYQIARCFRDEDLRADRQPEFTQLDVEMSFVDEEDVLQMTEGLFKQLFKSLMNVDFKDAFPRMTYAEAMQRFGSDKPDLRIPLELTDVKDLMAGVEFKVFAGPANDAEGRVAALRVPGGSDLTRKQIDDYTKFVGIYGAKGLAYIKVTDINAGTEGLQSPIVKFLPDDVVKAILERTNAENGDMIFFGADKATVVNEALGALRVKVGHDLNMVEDVWRFLWVVDFPMFEKDKQSGNWKSLHHPFTAPVATPESLAENPGETLSRAYDIVLNGFELGGGSIRIHDTQMQEAVFALLNIDKDTAQRDFGHLLQALRLGCPPHGGVALGLDRIVMLMTGADSLRDVIAFPKTQSAACPLTNAPTEASDAQLQELNLKLTLPVE